jgi:tripartite-type tricarboxylate transporter receptor subunit TctC
MMKMMKRFSLSKHFAAGTLLCLFLAGAILRPEFAAANGTRDASKSAYPSKPIQLVVPVRPGGDTDQNGRIFAKYLGEALGVNVVIVNIDGQATTVGMKNVIDAAADGYTALFVHTEALLPKIAGMVNFDLFDLKLAGNMMQSNTTVLATHKDSGFKTIQEFVDKAKREPGKLQFGMATGGYPHLIGVALEDVTGTDLNIVDVGGNADKLVALLGHKVDIINIEYALTQDYYTNGDFICLGLLSEDRNPMLPDIPTLKEQGYNMVFNKAFFLALPKDTPDDIRDILSSGMKKACENPKFKEDMAKYFIEINYMNPAQADEYWRQAGTILDSYGPVLKASVK